MSAPAVRARERRALKVAAASQAQRDEWHRLDAERARDARERRAENEASPEREERQRLHAAREREARERRAANEATPEREERLRREAERVRVYRVNREREYTLRLAPSPSSHEVPSPPLSHSSSRPLDECRAIMHADRCVPQHARAKPYSSHGEAAATRPSDCACRHYANTPCSRPSSGLERSTGALRTGATMTLRTLQRAMQHVLSTSRLASPLRPTATRLALTRQPLEEATRATHALHLPDA